MELNDAKQLKLYKLKFENKDKTKTVIIDNAFCTFGYRPTSTFHCFIVKSSETKLPFPKLMGGKTYDAFDGIKLISCYKGIDYNVIGISRNKSLWKGAGITIYKKSSRSKQYKVMMDEIKNACHPCSSIGECPCVKPGSVK